MLSWLAKIMLTCTAIAPVGFSYAWVAWFADKKEFAGLSIAASLFLVLVCIWVLRYAKNNLESFSFQVSSI